MNRILHNENQMASMLSFGPRGPGFNSSKQQMFFHLETEMYLKWISVDSTLRKNKSALWNYNTVMKEGGERGKWERYNKVEREKEATKSREYTQYKHENETLQIE